VTAAELLALGPGRPVRWRGLDGRTSAELLVNVTHDGRWAQCLTRCGLKLRDRWCDWLEPVERPDAPSAALTS
jgi:hypothetical protein